MRAPLLKQSGTSQIFGGLPRPTPSSSGPSPPSAYSDKATTSRRPRSLAPWVSQSSRQKLPQVPPNPACPLQSLCERLLYPDSPSPGSLPQEVPPSPGFGETPQSSAARAPLTPSLGFVPTVCKRSQEMVPAPLTASSFLRAASLHRPAVRSPGPSPALPPARPAALGSGRSSSGRPATRNGRSAVSAPLPARAATASSPPPTPRRSTGGDQVRAGEATPRGGGPDWRRRRGPFLPVGRRPLLTWCAGAAACRRLGSGGAPRAPRSWMRSPSGCGGGLRAARSRAPGPFVPALRPRGTGSSEAPGQFAVGVLLRLAGPGCAPHQQALRSCAHHGRAVDFCGRLFFFFK